MEGLSRRWTEPAPPPEVAQPSAARAAAKDKEEEGKGEEARGRGRRARRADARVLVRPREGPGPSCGAVAWVALILVAVVRLWPWLVASTTAACHAADRATLRHWLEEGANDAKVRGALEEVGRGRLADEAARIEGLLDRVAQRRATPADVHAVLAVPCSVALLQEVVHLRRQYADLVGKHTDLVRDLEAQQARLFS